MYGDVSVKYIMSALVLFTGVSNYRKPNSVMGGASCRSLKIGIIFARPWAYLCDAVRK